MVIKRLNNRMAKRDDAIFENLPFLKKASSHFNSQWFKKIFEKEGSRVCYVDSSKSIKHGVDQAIACWEDFLEKKGYTDVFDDYEDLAECFQVSMEQQLYARLDVIFEPGNKKTETVKANKIIIATGASPKSIPAIPVDKKNIITSTEAMILPELPKEMIIIGAGAIGIEFAYFYSVFGTKVTVIEMLDKILPIEDADVSKELARNFRKRKIETLTGTKVEKALVKGKKVEVTVTRKGETKKLTAEIVLNAIGVTGNVSGFGLEELGVELFKDHIKVNKETYETNIPGIFAIGDVIGAPWLAHVASADGIHCVERMKGINKPKIDYNNIPGCTYCQPQVASVGYTEEKAKELGYEIKVGKFPFMASGKAFAVGERDGFVKLIFDAKYGEILGGHIIGSEATELIAEVALARSLEATGESLIKTVHAHPTLSESIMEAAANAYGEAIHI